MLDGLGRGCVDFDEFCFGVSIFKKFSRAARLRCVFAMADVRGEGQISMAEFRAFVSMFDALYHGQRSSGRAPRGRIRAGGGGEGRALALHQLPPVRAARAAAPAHRRLLPPVTADSTGTALTVRTYNDPIALWLCVARRRRQCVQPLPQRDDVRALLVEPLSGAVLLGPLERLRRRGPHSAAGDGRCGWEDCAAVRLCGG